MRAARNLQLFQHIDRRRPLGLVVDQRLDVALVEQLLLVGQLLEALEQRAELVVGELVAQLLQPLAEGVPAGVLAQHQRVCRPGPRSRRS